MTHVLDASALLAYLEKEPGYEKVQRLLGEAAGHGPALLLSTVNWGEVFYVTHRTYGAAQAAHVAQVLETFPLELVPVHLELARQAALLKAVRGLPYADCFAAALAKTRKATLVTGDHDFKPLEGELKLLWL